MSEELATALASALNSISSLLKHDKWAELKAIRQDIDKKDSILELEMDLVRDLHEAGYTDVEKIYQARVDELKKQKEEKLELYKRISEQK